jgi:hypothetical protein
MDAPARRWQADDAVDRRLGVEKRAMPTSDRAAKIGTGCSPPSVARALLALAPAYMALAGGVSPPTVESGHQRHEMKEDAAGYGD